MPKNFQKQVKEMILSAVEYFELERENNGPLLPINATRERVAAALKISLSSVNKIMAQRNKGQLPESPKRKRSRVKPVVDIDSFDQCAIRNVIYDMYKNKEHITLQTLRQTLVDRELFNGSKTSLWKIVKAIGFTYNKDDPRRGLMELPHIGLKRVEFLRKYMRLKKEDIFQFVFLDETWIFQDGTIGRSWQDESVKSVKKTKVGGSRYIILHAGCNTGFIPGADLLFSSKTKDVDYHGEMNQDNFLHWFEHQLLPNLEKPSVIVMDNASYHSTIRNKVPTTASKKCEIHEWLKTNNIACDMEMFKAELLNLVKINKPKIEYVADALAEVHGHIVLRLPPYHCIFNPIEHIWGIAKSYYRDHVGKNGSSADKSIATWKEALNRVTPQIWAKTIQHTENEIEQWWNREVMFDREDVGPLIINVCDDDDTSSTEDI